MTQSNGGTSWRAVDLFAPTEEHRLLAETVREFVATEVEPQAAAYNREEKFNRDLFRRAGELGLLGLTVAEDDGGAGLDATAAVIVHEALSTAEFLANKGVKFELITPERMIGAEVDQLVHRLEHEEPVVIGDRDDPLGAENVVAVPAEIILQEAGQLLAVEGLRIDEGVGFHGRIVPVRAKRERLRAAVAFLMIVVVMPMIMVRVAAG